MNSKPTVKRKKTFLQLKVEEIKQEKMKKLFDRDEPGRSGTSFRARHFNNGIY